METVTEIDIVIADTVNTITVNVEYTYFPAKGGGETLKPKSAMVEIEAVICMYDGRIIGRLIDIYDLLSNEQIEALEEKILRETEDG